MLFIYIGEADFNATVREVTFNADNFHLPQAVAMEIIDDFIAEGMEAFTVSLGLSSNQVRADRVGIGLNQSTVFIEDNDGEQVNSTWFLKPLGDL